MQHLPCTVVAQFRIGDSGSLLAAPVHGTCLQCCNAVMKYAQEAHSKHMCCATTACPCKKGRC